MIFRLKPERLIAAGVLLLSVLTAFWMLSGRALDSHECFVSVTAREMLQSGDWVLPTCNGQLRINKTPLSYRLVGIAAKVTGKVDEFTARMPSAVFAILSAATILYFISRLLTFRIAVISTAVWATSLAYIHCSHNARPDMALAFFVTLCLLSFYSAINAENRSRQIIYALVFWISFALGNLAKGPAPIPFVLIPLAAYIIIFKQWKLLLKLLPFAGPAIFLVITLPWPLAVAQRVNWNLLVWKREFIDRLFGDYTPGHHPSYYYLGIMFKFTAPWVAFLPLALTAPYYKIWNEKRPAMKFLWLWFVAGFAFLTLNICRRQHYILPLMPAMAILIGILLEDMAFTRKGYTKDFAKNILKGHAVIIIAGMLGASVYLAVTKPHLLAPVISLGIVTIAASLFVILLFAKGKPALACASIFAGVTIWFMIAYFAFTPLLDINRPARDFALKVAHIVPQSERLISYQNASPRFVQYFGRVVPGIKDKLVLSNLYEQGNWVLCHSDCLDELAQDGCFRQVYYRQISPQAKKEKDNSCGALFHKSAPPVQDNGY